MKKIILYPVNAFQPIQFVFNRIVAIFYISCLSISFALAAKVDTVLTHSNAMQKDLKAVVILPANYETLDAVPVLYLLHGASGNYANWITRVPALTELADRYQMMVVCPDGNTDSWYWDSPLNAAYRYETYVGKELPNWIDERYKTIKGKEGRAITGLSMGGHGALYIAMKHQDTFGAAGSTAGGVDIRSFAGNWSMASHLGPYAEHPERWTQHTIMGLLHLLKPNGLSLIIDCGIEDFFYEVNEALHKQLLYRNIPHTYITGPGKHDWAYWTKSIRTQMQYFHYFFYPEGK